MLVKSLTLRDFIDLFKDYNRDHYTYEAYEAMFNHLEDISESCGEPIEIDVIALCGEFDELSKKDFLEQYELEDVEDFDGWCVELDNGFILYQS